MDALPILEASNRPWSSKILGKMHACGHDGHTAMLLAAAKYLAATRNFRGAVALIFQPAQEVEAPSGGKRMVQEGIIASASHKCSACTIDLGWTSASSAFADGPIMASQDDFDIVVKGRGGHAAKPHEIVDPVVIAAQIILGLQTLVSRHTSPIDSLVISVTKLNAAQAYNVIPDNIEMSGTVRTAP
ncbi:amidohydrolase [Bradyrhizobium sp. CB82]|uniref:amidohydrolase n=1 Tax=Bradyrhizobium sp. CB82 TaxID=3039159 RepID=UPI0024B1AADC|nr:amidohydrolase [Bradyrhizobium sp. CB82]WFU40023.1 amidohydrolase [Bradyrhizobium sp. CB82]